jgi:phosphate:Na+ symporter
VILAGIGILMSIVMQSSTAAGAATLVALNAGSLTFEQGCAMIVGQSVGTAATTGLVMVGGARGAALGTGAHHLQCDRRHAWDPVSWTTHGSGRLGGRSTL